jgi:hypothetical protein
LADETDIGTAQHSTSLYHLSWLLGAIRLVE